MKVNKIRILLLATIVVLIVSAINGTAAVRQLSALELSIIRGSGYEGEPCQEEECACACWENECDQIFVCAPVYDTDTGELAGYAQSDDPSMQEDCLYTTENDYWQCDKDLESEPFPGCMANVYEYDDCTGTILFEDDIIRFYPCSTIKP